MEDTQKILLNSAKNKKETNESVSIRLDVYGNKILLPEDAINAELNSYEVYLDERKKSNKFRLTINISPYCTNVLFNPFTEIVLNEGSSIATCLNYLGDKTNSEIEYLIGPIGIDKKIIAKDIDNDFRWNQYEAIRDTQLSNEACGFDYHCGIDIFNNHILRNKGTKAVNYTSNSRKKIGRLYNGDPNRDPYGTSYSKVLVNISGNSTNYEHIYLDKNFNTIDDYMRDKNGWIVPERFSTFTVNGVYFSGKTTGGGTFFGNNQSNGNTHGGATGNFGGNSINNNNNVGSNFGPDRTGYNANVVFPLHLYQEYDIMSFRDCINDKLIDNNGWYGFKNPSLLRSFSVEEKPVGSVIDNVLTEMDINKTINNRESGDFIDLYPGRDLYSFTPKYNKYRRRLEKNWNYCITYPSKNVIKNEFNGIEFPFFNIDESGNTSLKVYMFDEGTVDDGGTQLVTIYTVCQHGLVVGDIINLYKGENIFYDSAEVVNVVDKYIFQIYKTEGDMSNYWVEVEDRYTEIEITDKFSYDNSTPTTEKISYGMLIVDSKYYPICESNRCNVDPEAQNIHFRRVVNGVECKYYVRKFHRLPNFKFKDEEINDYTLYGNGNNGLIDKFSTPENKYTEFESHISKLGFAETTYGDDISEIVFTDDIDTSYLRDNLGRPLSEIYLTIVKNNSGYKEWYGIGKGKNASLNTSGETIEYSHCFGKVSSSFLLSDYFRESYSARPTLYDVRDLTSNGNNGIIIKNTDEINYNNDLEYYGDICCYSPVDCDEQVIQSAMHRFNTAQRDLSTNDTAYYKFNEGVMYHDEIYDTENNLLFSNFSNIDPYDKFINGSKEHKKASDIDLSDKNRNLYHTTREEITNMLSFREGYYYKPHYKIQIKEVSSKLSYDNATKYEIIDVKRRTDNSATLFEIKTSIDNFFDKNEKVTLYKVSTNEYYFVTVRDIIDFKRFTCSIFNEKGESVNSIDGFLDENNINDYILLKKHESVPDYARLIKDGSCRYCWRDIVSNGIESNDDVYPFTNDAFYVQRQINFFLRRQDPLKQYLSSGTYNEFVPMGEDIRNYPNFNTEYETNYEAKEIKEC